MEEDIKILEEYCRALQGKHLDNRVRAIENLIKRNKELEENYDKLTKHFIEKHIPKTKVEEIRDKAEVMDYYTLPDVIDDLNKLLDGGCYK